MREIEARGWDGMKMYYFDLASYMVVNEEAQENMCPCTANRSLMLYTGLHDKNGKKIHEGDIVVGKRDSHWHDGYDRVRGKAYFSYSHLAFKVDGIGGGSLHDVEEIEVIGNIYENPELAEEAS
ncbi:YopX family protein [Brevibacillus laterosporus]|uniref:YopX family protein n=1 Tax=Brevibacillus laterosporus TaxID=1465 RepID=A0AAP3DKE3_BRELA|nr:YopX family protein [Brevibacillus laterosporus]MCR8981475.1 YopX family protein [Brevibacillus laterosporus]MCZ0808630.1 YopX family protein [Brevibacillus laterosporus]MCZ0827092.1 YopX family protein [Brevibacillus laterosporus]MCZ0850800.1 YopX family protein [Brevibacillus laterosporus]